MMLIKNIRITAVRLAALLVLAALISAGVQAAMAAENTMTMSVGKISDLRTDLTISSTLMPEIGGRQYYHYYTHFSPLITQDGDGNIIPWLAESYEISDDHKTVTFHLRKGVKFADGTPFNASVAKYNFDRIITYGWPDYVGINGTGAKLTTFIHYDYSEAPDDYTFVLHFKQGWLDVARDLTISTYPYIGFISPLDVEPAWDINGALKQEKKYNGLGPYYLDENESVPKQKIVLKRRQSWQDDLNFHKPTIDKIVLTCIAEPQTAVLALEKGEIDYICRNWNPSLDSLSKLEGNTKITIETRPDTKTYYLSTAWWKEPFNGTDGILLRKAICYALDREEMVEGAFNGYATPATDTMWLSPLSPEVPKCCSKGYGYNLENAKKMLTEAGWKDSDGDGILDKNGRSLKDLNLVITSSTDFLWMKDLALIVQSQLRKIGIDVEIRTLEWADYAKARSKSGGDYDLILQYNNGRAVSMARELIYFNSTLTAATQNLYRDSNGTLEGVAYGARMASNTDELDEYACQACEILYDEAGVIPLVHPSEYALMSKKINGFEFGVNYWLDHVEECRIED
ncbi:MAG: putative ABC transporter periplasmic-binding protein [Methanosaeta sp. PtaU1.Bin112]|nr:MAG: putative ABC transporter periplasmic-binding protein [Methanosaeta sp. PtaU1.Bin112]